MNPGRISDSVDVISDQLEVRTETKRELKKAALAYRAEKFQMQKLQMEYDNENKKRQMEFEIENKRKR